MNLLAEDLVPSPLRQARERAAASKSTLTAPAASIPTSLLPTATPTPTPTAEMSTKGKKIKDLFQVAKPSPYSNKRPLDSVHNTKDTEVSTASTNKKSKVNPSTTLEGRPLGLVEDAQDSTEAETASTQKKRKVKPFTGKKRKLARKECSICADSISINQFLKDPHPGQVCANGSEICVKCWQQSLATDIEAKAWDQVKCLSCNHAMQEPEIKKLATRAVYQAWQHKATLAFLANGEGGGPGEVRVTCPLASCKGAGMMEAGCTWFHCDQCETTYCTACEVAMHHGETCQAYRERKAKEDETSAADKKRRVKEEAKSEKVVQAETKACPNPKCSVQKLQKSEGCDHFRCTVCRWEFCWRCLAPYKGPTGISTVGNTAHAATCAYHSGRLPDYHAPRL